MMNTDEKISQENINKALWAACDTCKDFIFTMLFLKYISDVWQEKKPRQCSDGETSVSWVTWLFFSGWAITVSSVEIHVPRI